MRYRDAAGRFVHKPCRANKNLVGQRFEDLLVLRFAGYIRIKNGTRRVWKCCCRCGRKTLATTNQLTTGGKKSCGCRKRAATILRNKQRATHRHTCVNSPTYRSWQAMRQRCLNPNSHSWPDYGGRGIRICERWASFETFLADMGERPAGTTLSRFADRGDYRPGNCAWHTRNEQQAERLKKLLRNDEKTRNYAL